MSTLQNNTLMWVLIALGAFAFGLLMAWLVLRSRMLAAGRESRDVEFAQLAGERDAALEARRRLQGESDARARELAETRAQLSDVSAERATMSGRLERLTQVEEELARARSDNQEASEARQRAEQQATALSTRLHEQTHAAHEKISLLERVREEFSDKFKALAGDLLEEKSKKFTEHNQASLGTLLNPLREQLGDFRKRVDEVYDKESRERELLKAEIETLKTLNKQIDEDARNLTRALTRDSKSQGAWGELVLERLLEASGLQRGREYEMQVALHGDDGGRPRPDVIVHLPESRDLIIDAKVSLTAYERYCAAADDHERGHQLSAHLASLRNHVKELASKRYSDLPGVNSLEFVLMFVPVEAAYIEAVHRDEDLHAFALERQVVIVTTSTLLATLRTVSSLWRFDDRNRNAFEIADRAGKLYDKFVGFVEDIEDVGAKLDAARGSLRAAKSKLASGRGNLVGQVEKLRVLGARSSKTLPDGLLDDSAVANEERTDDNATNLDCEVSAEDAHQDEVTGRLSS
ncbi:MAG: DNA recombination protein RmuC [Rudaea sp.]